MQNVRAAGVYCHEDSIVKETKVMKALEECDGSRFDLAFSVFDWVCRPP